MRFSRPLTRRLSLSLCSEILMSGSQTQSGTYIINGIEYNEPQVPLSLIKAMEEKWAARLRDKGAVRLSAVEYYQSLEHPELGDNNEAKGVLRVDGHEMKAGSANEVYIWCAATSDAPYSKLKGLYSSYNSILHVRDVAEFVRRILSAARDNGYRLYPHLGKVNYNRGKEVSIDVLNGQKFHYNVFQKSPTYAHQKEYRLSFTNVSRERIGNKHIDLEIGNCRDIIDVET